MYDDKIIVLGFYNRQNIGDDAYISAIPRLLPNASNIIFISMDDAVTIPADTNIVIIGGGDLINEYFMEKAQTLLKEFIGRVYGVSIGIPFQSSVKYLHMFDHVFVRSQVDYARACAEVGGRNVTCIPDISVCLPCIPKNGGSGAGTGVGTGTLRLGVCLANPLFFNNPRKSALALSIVTSLVNLYQAMPNIQIHFLAFNHNVTSPMECDYGINTLIAKKLAAYSVPYVVKHDINTPRMMLEYISKNIDITLCMRFHSIMFSLLTNTRFVALHCSPKVDNVLVDVAYDTNYIYKVDTDNKYRPLEIDDSRLTLCLKKACLHPDFSYSFPGIDNIPMIEQLMLKDKKTHDCCVHTTLRSFEDVLLSCRRNITKYMNMSLADYEVRLNATQAFPMGDKEPIEVARFICFIITGQTSHPCLWGLLENMAMDTFCLYSAIKYIWEYCKEITSQSEREVHYYPKAKTFERRVLINLDYVFHNDFTEYHRSGWGYVVGGLMNLDAAIMHKETEVLLDTYVDRSFHWGYDILRTIGVVPYKKPWYGFVHHTFDTSHSEYNCTNLFKNPLFLESLKCCQGLLALSNSLASSLRAALASVGRGGTSVGTSDVPVYVVYHPMETVDNMFTMEKFTANPNKRVVQIGAWLRNPYSIYELPLPLPLPSSNGDSMQLRKVALKGKEMDMYFPPPNFAAILKNTLLQTDWYHTHKSDAAIPAVSAVSAVSAVCRPRNSVNKYCQGLVEMVERHCESVEVLERLTNDEYDELLSQNIVFLCLVDCSAVNTVLECIVRNTVLIVNRLPALEEILGVNYPGFYTTLQMAADMCQDMAKIREIYTFMSKLDKERYTLDFFLDHVQNIITNGDDSYSYNLFVRPPIPKNVFQARFAHLLKFLPAKFTY